MLIVARTTTLLDMKITLMNLMTEFVLVGETVQDWSQMITIQALIGYRPETLKVLRLVSQNLLLINVPCDQEIIWNDVQYGYNFLVLAISCHETQMGHPEHMLVKQFKVTTHCTSYKKHGRKNQTTAN